MVDSLIRKPLAQKKKKLLKVHLSAFTATKYVSVASSLNQGKDTSRRQAGTTCPMHQSSWVWSIQFLPEEDLDASPLTTWFGGPFGVTGRQWLTMMTSRPSYYKFTWPHCPPGTELPRLSRRLVTPCVQLTISLVCHSEDTTRNRTPRSVCYILMWSGQKIDTRKKIYIYFHSTVWPWEHRWGWWPDNSGWAEVSGFQSASHSLYFNYPIHRSNVKKRAAPTKPCLHVK